MANSIVVMSVTAIFPSIDHGLINSRMDLFPNEQHFDLDKARQTFHHSLKEHHKISNIPKFRCEML
jgi:hypothetical protein